MGELRMSVDIYTSDLGDPDLGVGVEVLHQPTHCISAAHGDVDKAEPLALLAGAWCTMYMHQHTVY